ncbi:MAG: multidrug efflux MFS transporter [Natronospirillum sp.]|uniref:MDR family MFS transporter n=1 Tax=Natronospirillum sp. TaxID=2812955 RepID=UPI0025F3FBAE|nr:MDR family MFS transporter [Natronospirillum sp.]MCH8552944.1 multidrug efflux MFS transporter [Natronospirillum sp.]
MEQASATEINRPLILGVLIFGGFVVVLNQTLMLVAIPPIMRDFDITASQAQWVTTGFMLANGILIPVSAALIDRFSSRSLYLVALSIFLLGTVIGANAQSFPMLLLARIIQGISAGIAMPLGQTVIMSLFPPEKRGAAMGLVGMIIAFAPAIGPTLSGWLIEQHSWRFLFIVLLPFSVLVLVAAWWVMTDVTMRRDSHINPTSVTLSTLGWGGLLYGFSMAGSVGWANANVWGALGIGAVALAIFIPLQLRMANPMLEFRVFRYRTFALTTLLSMIVFSLLIGPQTLLPFYVQNARGFGALQTGLLLLPGAIVMGVMSLVSGRLFDRFGIKWLAVAGLLQMAAALSLFAGLDHDTPLSRITWGFMLHMMGIATLMMPLITAGINAMPRELISHGTAMNNTLRMVSASIVTALLVTLMSSRAAMLTDVTDEAALIAGVRTAFMVAAGIALTGAVLAFQLRDRITDQ